jgi:hypothetical protein
MKIQPIVEGHGEVEAVPVLLRRLLYDEAGVFDVEVNRPIRRPRTALVNEASLRISVQIALLQQCSGILILFDGDDDCPKELAPQVENWAKSEAGNVPCAVVMANREYKAWLLSAIESLRGKRGIRADAGSHPDPESPRDAKGQIEMRVSPTLSYMETRDQAALTSSFDFAAAHAHCRSFRRMVRAFEIIVRGAGIPLANWPPSSITGH